MAAPTAPQALSPMWWLNRLSEQLAQRQEQMDMFDRYYSGDHPLPFLTKAHESKIRSEFRGLLEDSRSNFMRLVVDVVEERMMVEGFRLSASSDAGADKDSWDIWQANQLDADSNIAFIESLIKGVAYTSVWKTPGAKYPTIAIEDPSQTIVGYVPGSNFRQRASALKIWTDDWTGFRRANVYLPDGIYKFQAPTDSNGSDALVESDKPRWVELEDQFAPNPTGIVPIVPLRNRPRLLWEGESELADVYRIQNQINGFLFLLAIAGYFGAHRQRWVSGISLMEDDNGRPMEPFDSAVDKLWVAEETDAKFGDFEESDLTGYIKAVEEKVLHIAVTTRTPRHYLIESGQAPSGDAIKSAESGLVKKVERKQRPLGEGLEETMRLARMFNGKSGDDLDSEIIWADADTESIATLTDAVLKQFGGGLIPWEGALEKLGYTPQTIARFKAMKQSDALMKAIVNPDAGDDWTKQVDA